MQKTLNKKGYITVKKEKKGYSIRNDGRIVKRYKTKARARKNADILRRKMGKTPLILKKSKKQSKAQSSGYSKRNDKKVTALPPGKRISKSGNIYYEYRKDHSDINPRTNL